MARIVVAGASGLTGLALVRQLAGEHEVVAVARRSAPQNLPSGVSWISADIGSPGWTDALPAEADAVTALFQSPEFREFPTKAGAVFATNVGGLQELLGYAARAKIRRFVFTSTGGLYAPATLAVGEDAPLSTGGPLGYYLTTKRCGELLIEAYAGLFSTLTVRPFFIYGPGQADQMLIPRLIASVRSGKPLGLQGQDGLSINPIHVDDAARLLARAMTNETRGVLNLAGPEIVTLRQVGETLGKLTGLEPQFDINANVASPFVVGDISRMTTELGSPTIGVADGLATMISSSKPSH